MAAAAERTFAVEPSLDEVRELAAQYNLVALRHTFIDDLETPVSAFLKLRGSSGAKGFASRAACNDRRNHPGRLNTKPRILRNKRSEKSRS